MQVLIVLLNLKNHQVKMTLYYSTCFLYVSESYLLTSVTKPYILLPLPVVSQPRSGKIKFVGYFALLFLKNKSQSEDI